ncbi:hypothetical protein T484DRAFT_2028009, partial [Baffinella frigidus]
MFTFAMRKRYEATACDKYKHEYEKMTFMRIGLLGQIGHFRDQAALLCQRAEEMISGAFDAVRFDSAAGLFKRAHKIAEKHGFISIESRVWAGRGQMSWCGYAGFEPWRKNDCRHYPVLNYESILYLRNAVCAGRLSEIHSTDLQFNAFFNLAQALFKCRDACKCPECMVVPLDDMLNLSEEMATAELEHVFEQIGRCKHYVGVLLNMKKGLPDVAERHIKDLLEYVAVLTTPPPTVTRSSLLTTHVVDPENISNISESQST